MTTLTKSQSERLNEVLDDATALIITLTEIKDELESEIENIESSEDKKSEIEVMIGHLDDTIDSMDNACTSIHNIK